MQSLRASKLREELSDTLNRVVHRRERIVLERRGKRVAVLVPVEDAELLEVLEDRLDLEAARQALRDPRRITWKKLKAQLGL